MPTKVAEQFFRSFEQLAAGDETGLDITNLKNRDGFRLRVREWRAIYLIDNDKLVIVVLDAGPRRGIY